MTDADREEPYAHSVTNTVWEAEDGTIRKYFSRLPWTVGVMDALNLLFLDIGITRRKQRMQNEMDAKKTLHSLDIPVQAVRDQDGWTVTLEKVPGRPLDTYLQDATPEDSFKVGRRKGEELRTVHDAGYAYRDCRCGNTVVDGDTLYSIDHELFESEAAGHHQMLDILTLLGTAKRFPWDTYSAFLRGFQAGYGDAGPLPRTRVVLELPCAIGFAVIVDRRPRPAGRVIINWLRERFVNRSAAATEQNV